MSHVLFEDESMIRDYQAIGKSWFYRGKQRLIKTYGQHKGAKLIGCLNYETGEVLCQEKQSYDAVSFREFLHYVLKHYPSGKIVMILDNARIHHARLLQPFFEEHRDRLELVFLPSYSPKLNLMEGVWKWLKESVINNVFFPNVQKIVLAVQGFLRWISGRKSEVIDRLCVQM